jgi:hypothetical protein
MTCLTGHFHSASSDSLGEVLLKRTGGALAVWASSGMTDPQEQAAMNREFYRLYFSGDAETLGQATMRSKAVVNQQDIRRTWILFGDPSTLLTRN